MKPFADLPAIDMTVEQIFAANQQANTPIPIRRRNKTANPDASQTPDASAFSATTDLPVATPKPVAPPPAGANAPVKSVERGAMSGLGPLPISSRKWGELWWPLALVTMLVVGIGGGWLYTVAGDLADRSVFVSLAIIGALCGAAFLPAIRVGKNRSPVAAVVVASVTCALVYLTMLAWSGLQMRAMMLEQAAPIIAARNKIPVALARQKMEQRLTPQRAISLYVEDLNTYGVTLMDSDKSRVNGSTSGGTHLTGLGFWCYFAFQICLSALVAGGIVSSVAKAPFHEGSGVWYRKFAAYALHPSHVGPLLNLCREGKWSEAGRLAKSSKTNGSTGATATVYFLPNQGGFVRVSSSERSGSKTIFETTLSADEVKLWKPI